MGKRHIVIGTAGHIDHGKSALIKALTGVDPDRLKEEKERGMTTDLGFVFYGSDVTIIDVPGHEKFVRHMVAGASTIDLVIFVVAADDGVMPQTIEHLDILKLLAIKQGLIAVTKKDLVPEEQLQTVINDVRNLVAGTFLDGMPIIPVSNITGEGIKELQETLDKIIAGTETKKDRGIFRLPIDRCFTIKGFGTVIAGTVLSGSVKIGDTLELMPARKKVKVRGIQVHNQKVDKVGTGFRTAINLAGVEKEEIKRGDTLSQVGYFEPSNYMNVSLYLLKSAPGPLKNLTRLRIHLGTKEIFGRVALLDKKILNPGEKAMAQFRLETPAVSDVGDRYVIRTYSPQMTIGGGVIIEPKAQKTKGFDEKLLKHLQKVETGDPMVMIEENLLSNFELPRKIFEIGHDLNLPADQVEEFIKRLIQEEKVLCIDEKRNLYYSSNNLEKLKKKIREILGDYHKKNPTKIGMPQLELYKAISTGLDKSLLNYTLERMVQEKSIKIQGDNRISLYDFDVVLDENLERISRKIEKLFLEAGYKPPDYQTLLNKNLGPAELVKKAYRYMIEKGTLINVGESIILHRELVKEAEKKLVDFLKKNKEIKVFQFRDMLKASRRYVLPLLIYFDTNNITIKRGEVRVLGQKYQ
ncbi:MAG TPA: selenocysteine-specific translation elongation factor [candidate division WOR-3 bacterium]|uniref:Selenocysteine-specific elongation factor n=1 Tax=candidate division WOR-3 bacterium TaxID=2052148 RepID=A0A9C9ELG7_UNCW3|nr:selenocysteine-specific translation elongation factor [candidate division WOR-3 bacterium]